jgi:hypothetical protein
MDEPRAPDEREDEKPPLRPVVVTETFVTARAWKPSWWPLFVLGLVAVVFGALVLANVWSSLRLVALFAGILLVFAGVVQLVAASGARRRGAGLAGAVVTLLVGVVVLMWPEGSLKALAVLVGASFIVWGLLLAWALRKDHAGGSSAGTAFGVTLAIIGLVVVFWPGPTVAVLMALVGAGAIIFGVLAIAQALALRRA